MILTFHSNHGPISYRFRDKWRFRPKIAKFSHSRCILRACWRGSSWNWIPALGTITRMIGATGRRKKFGDIFSHVNTMHQRDRQTDRKTPGDSKVRAYAERRAVKIDSIIPASRLEPVLTVERVEFDFVAMQRVWAWYKVGSSWILMMIVSVFLCIECPSSALHSLRRTQLDRYRRQRFPQQPPRQLLLTLLPKLSSI